MARLKMTARRSVGYSPYMYRGVSRLRIPHSISNSQISVASGGALPAVRQDVEASSALNTIFVVQNVFQVKQDSYDAFEEVWRTRESHLREMPGFIRFAMLKCENVPGKYISQTTWATKADFENWTQSSQFRKSHGEKDSKRPSVGEMLQGPPSPELYSSVTITE